MIYTEKIFTVTEINSISSRLLEETFDTVVLEAEISNLKLHSSGHMYFTLKDPGASIDSVMYSSYVNKLSFNPKNGDKVIVRGKISVFVRGGRYQIISWSMKRSGAGALDEKFRLLKAKLDKEGLFSREQKKNIRSVPEFIAVITSPTGAALRDILNILKRRHSGIKILIIPARVQGPGAAEEICRAIEKANTLYKGRIDTLILTRGGGSLEDLWPFNEEKVARAVFSSEIPVISAVGHETDFTISDFVADLRAPTPSAAAELVIKNKEDLKKEISRAVRILRTTIKGLIDGCALKLRRLDMSVFNYTARHMDQLMQEIDHISGSLSDRQERLLTSKAGKLDLLASALHSLSPEATMRRGYSITFLKKEGTVIKDHNRLKKGDIIVTRFTEGTAESRII